MEELSIENSCAVVVTYNPVEKVLLNLLVRLNKETDFIVIDNNSANIEQIGALVLAYQRCKALIKNSENVGLAKALNIGINWAGNHRYDLIFLFDQDSIPGDHFVSHMITSYKFVNQFSDKGVAAIGPRIVNPQTLRKTPFKLFNRLLLRSDRRFASSETHFIADFLITSGTLIALRHLSEIGAMKEEYFIDNIDLEWCFRAKSMGFDLVGTDEAVLYHSIGEQSDHPFVRAGLIVEHNPARIYYTSRNRTHLYGTNYSPLGWKLRDKFRFAMKVIWLLLSSPKRQQYWHNIYSGIKDAKKLS